jgi:hypothetical protein
MESNDPTLMSLAAAILTNTTCGEACWQAREDICRCSCGGKNHGCLRSADGVRPTRTAKLSGKVYELEAVGEHGELYDLAKARNEANGPYRTDTIPASPEPIVYRYFYHETDNGAPARLKPATKDQIARWPELAAYRDLPPTRAVYLLWRKAGA